MSTNVVGAAEHKREIGRRLEKVRAPRSQASYARKIDVIQQTWSNYESGRIPDSWLFLAKLADDEGVDLNDLLGAPNGS